MDLENTKEVYTIDQLKGKKDASGVQIAEPYTRSSNSLMGNDPPTTSYLDAVAYTIKGRTWTYPQALAHELLHAHDFFLHQPTRGTDHTDPGWIQDEQEVTDEAASVGDTCK